MAQGAMDSGLALVSSRPDFFDFPQELLRHGKAHTGGAGDPRGSQIDTSWRGEFPPHEVRNLLEF